MLGQVGRAIANFCHREHEPFTKAYVVNCPGLERFWGETQYV
jgi:hypothetical protein